MPDVTSSFNEIKIDGDNNKIYIGSQDKFEPMMEWMEKKIKLEIKGVGKRYAPNNNQNINISVKIANIFNFFNNDTIIFEYIFRDYQKIHSLMFGIKYSCESFLNYNFVDWLHLSLNKESKKYRDTNIKNNTSYINFRNDILKLIKDITNQTNDFLVQFRKIYISENFKDMSLPLQKDIIKLIELITNLQFKLSSDEKILCYVKQNLFISGEALIGKTHLFCDVTLKRFKNNQPTLLFFGNNFDGAKTIIYNMITQLGLMPISEDDFLKALNKWGEEYHTQTLIMIDAINETQNSKIWQEGIIKFCEQIKSYPNLALAMSVRDVEKNKIITPENEEYIANEIVEVEHKGFEGIEIEAVKTFCEVLEVEFPKVPLHTYRLFVNAGMLFLYIETIKNSTKKVDTSIINPLTIFKSYLADLERKYYQKYMNEVDEEDEVVSEAITEFIALGTKEDYIHFYLDYKEVKKKLKPLHTKILEFLISEGVLNKLKNEEGTKLYFTYQKFENFFIGDYLLNNFDTNKDNIFKLIREYNGAISEALFMQIPEKLNKDIFDLNVWFIRDRYICEQYIESLVWRNPNTINDMTFKYINFILHYHELANTFLDTVLQLSTIPNHPLNIERLHKKLLKFKLSERDYNWTIYIHQSFRADEIVKRIINWAWDKKEEFEIENESLYLYGLTLGWFLTSSNRELRDGDTKALVNLFTDRINIFLRVLKEFETVDDLYVLERLYAVGYGIILRSRNPNGFKELGKYIYKTIFDKDEVIEHILLRDYAKLTVDYINKSIELNVHLEKIYPPYNQNRQWKLPEINKEEVEKYEDKYWRIYASSLNEDFKIYIIYRYANHFLNLKIKDKPHPKTVKARYDEFFDALTKEQEEEYNKTRLDSNELLTLINNLSYEEFEEEVDILELDSSSIDSLKEIKINKSSFKELLSSEQLQEYNDFIVNYKQKNSREMGINVKYVKRLIFLEAIKMGWDKELFEFFDNNANNGRGYDEGTERIGKKYQWIALYKVLSKLTDNYEFREESYGEKIVDYKGMYQFSFKRDIDPTTVLKNKHKKDDRWWFNIDESFEDLDISDREWMSSTDKLPTIKELANIKKEDREYLSLNLSISIDGDKKEENYRNLYYHFNSFVIKKDCIKSFVDWLGTINYYGQDKLPQSSSLHDMYLREYPNSEAFKHLDTYYHGQIDWDDEYGHEGKLMPCKILLTSTSYMNEGRSYDKSVDETIEIGLPNKWFVREMDLKQTLIDGEWKNQQDEIVFCDPTIETGSISPYNENGSLVADKELLMKFLESNGYSLIWIMWGEKQVRNNKKFNNDEFLGIAEISGYGYFDGNEFIENMKINFEERE